jgi:hypothetical protein
MDTRIDSHRLRTGHLNESDLQNVMESMGRLAAVPIYIEDTPGLSIMEVRSKARRLQSQSGVDLIIIDYLQLMAGKRSDNRVQEVSEISRGWRARAERAGDGAVATLARWRDDKPHSMLSDLEKVWHRARRRHCDVIYREELYDKKPTKRASPNCISPSAMARSALSQCASTPPQHGLTMIDGVRRCVTRDARTRTALLCKVPRCRRAKIPFRVGQ